MSGSDAHSTPNIKAGLLINRLLYEGRGNEMLEVVSDLVRSGELKLSEEPVRQLLETVQAGFGRGQPAALDGDARD